MTANSNVPILGATIHQLKIKDIFDGLDTPKKLYAHYLARAAWSGSRIIMRQVSSESTHIFDFILDLYKFCGGEWNTLANDCCITSGEMDSFLEYAAMFLCNLGNYYGEGNQKFVPNVTKQTLWKMAMHSPRTMEADPFKIIGLMLAVPPFCLGYPSRIAQSGYYPSDEPITRDDIARVSKVMNRNSIGPENTRLRKVRKNDKTVLELLQASAESDQPCDGKKILTDNIVLIRGDHWQELENVCSELKKAIRYASNREQKDFLEAYIECFRTGNLEAFRKSQEAWLEDRSSRVENIMGFIEPYRDPAGIRAEWEAMVGIADADEVKMLKTFVNKSTFFIRQLPWVVESVESGNGPFERKVFEAPDFTSVHALAVCGSVVFEAANLPNYECIRETCGSKNIVLTNRLSANNNPNNPCYWVKSCDLQLFKETTHIVRYLTTAVHELIGHGTGKLLRETSAGVFNFDKDNPPINPLTEKAVSSYYLHDQSWESVFGKLAGTVEECRAILISEYLMDNEDLLRIFGYTNDSSITAEDLLYATYLNIGADGLQALEHYNIHDRAWGQVHHQAHFSILKHLLQDGGGVIRISHDSTKQSLTVNVDRYKTRSHGKPSLSRYLHRLHIWRCTADVSACKRFYEPMCAVEGLYEEWREIVLSKPNMKWKFVQPNTFLNGKGVDIKVYEETNEGIIQSWAERDV